jgi:hypothetical protein
MHLACIVVVTLKNDETKQLRVGSSGEDAQRDSDGVTRSTYSVLTQRVEDDDAALGSQTDYQPTGDQIADVLGEIVHFAGGVAVHVEQT